MNFKMGDQKTIYPMGNFRDKGSTSIVGAETKAKYLKSCRSESSGTIFMYGKTEFW